MWPGWLQTVKARDGRLSKDWVVRAGNDPRGNQGGLVPPPPGPLARPMNPTRSPGSCYPGHLTRLPGLFAPVFFGRQISTDFSYKSNFNVVSSFWYHNSTTRPMPPKIRELTRELTKAGFKNRGGKGSHRNYVHPSGVKITIGGNDGDDAKKYQVQDTGRALKRCRNEKK